jgi:predicted MFS family arabinose efflux permease
VTKGTDASIPVTLNVSARLRIFAYLGCLIALLSFSDPNGGILDIPMSFVLKNQMHMEAHDLANFRLIASIPLYLSFIFGLCRDSWSAKTIRDPEIIGVFSLLSAALYLVLALLPLSYFTILLAALLPTASFLFAASAQSGLTASISRQHAMSGQASAVWNIFISLPAAVAFIIGGHLSQLLEEQNPATAARMLFYFGAAASVAVFTYSTFRPRIVFENVQPAHNLSSKPASNITKLLQHRPVYPALAIWLLWNFSPGSITPLQYYLQDVLRATDIQWGLWNAIFTVSFVPTFALYGFLSIRYSIGPLLWWGTLFAIPQFVPLLFVNSLDQALFIAVPVGLMGGIATAAYLDLIIRSCPRGLEGAMVMMSGGLYFVSTRIGDVVGTFLYDQIGGFATCVFLMTATYTSIPFVLFLIPKDVLAGEENQLGANLRDESSVEQR